MKKAVLFICMCVAFSFCNKKDVAEDVTTKIKNGEEVLNSGSANEDDPDAWGGCFDAYFKTVKANPDSIGAAYIQLNDCTNESIKWPCLSCPTGTPPNDPQPKSLCERFPFLCQSKIYQPEGEFPNLLAILGLDNSSSRSDIATVHNFLQKYNSIILGAVAANTSWLNLSNTDKRNGVLVYYADVYLLTNPAFTTAELNFLLTYINLLFYDGIPRIGDIMMVPPIWVYKLFYDGVQPLEYPDANGNFSDPNFSFSIGENTFLDIIGVPFGFLPLVTS